MKKNSRWSIAAIILVLLFVSACSPQPVEPPLEPTRQPQANPTSPAQESPMTDSPLISDRPRQTSPQIPSADLQSLATGNSAFAVDLYRRLMAEDGNLFYSPYSISLALAMTYAGARAETERQMADTLHFGLPQASLHPAFNALDQQLRPLTRAAGVEDFRLNIANSLWGQQGFEFNPEFLDTLAENYGAGMYRVDFAQSEAARQLINDWVAEQTEQKIEDLIPEGALNDLTRLVLANAIYFKGNWVYPFDQDATRPADFNLLDGSTASVPMMALSATLPYTRGDGYQAVQMSYRESNTSMVAVVPDVGTFEAFEQGLDAAALEEVLAGFSSAQVELKMPKFKVESSFGLRDALQEMGMPLAFDPDQADFSGMSAAPDMFISDVVHKAYVNVDEEGTEAAAATAVIVGVTSMPAETVQLTIDRPFLFLIIDRTNNTILFMGRVVNPS